MHFLGLLHGSINGVKNLL